MTYTYEPLDLAEEKARKRIIKGMRRSGYAAAHGTGLFEPKRAPPQPLRGRPYQKSFMQKTTADHRLDELVSARIATVVDAWADAFEKELLS